MMEMAGNMVVCQGLDHVSLESIEGTDSGEGDGEGTVRTS